MTIIVSLPEFAPMTATAAIVLLGEKEFTPCTIFQMLDSRVKPGTIRNILSRARLNGHKIPRWTRGGPK